MTGGLPPKPIKRETTPSAQPEELLGEEAFIELGDYDQSEPIWVNLWVLTEKIQKFS